MTKISDKDLLDIIHQLTHIADEDGNEVPFYCFASDITSDLDLTDDYVSTVALKNGYKVFKVFPGETMIGGYLICAEGCSKEPIETMYQEFYGEVPEIAEIELDDEKLKEKEQKEIEESLEDLTTDELKSKVDNLQQSVDVRLGKLNSSLDKKSKCRIRQLTQTISEFIISDGKLLVRVKENPIKYDVNEVEFFDNVKKSVEGIVGELNAISKRKAEIIKRERESIISQKEKENHRKKITHKKNKTEKDYDELIAEYKPSEDAESWLKEHTTNITAKMPSKSVKKFLYFVPDAVEDVDFKVDDSKTSGGSDNQWGISLSLHVDSLKECPVELIDLFNKEDRTITKTYPVLAFLRELGAGYWKEKQESLTEGTSPDNPWLKQALTYLNKYPNAYGYICSYRHPKTHQQVGVAKGFMKKEDFDSFVKKLIDFTDTKDISSVFQGQQDLYKDESLNESYVDELKRTRAELIKALASGKTSSLYADLLANYSSVSNARKELKDIETRIKDIENKNKSVKEDLNVGMNKEQCDYAFNKIEELRKIVKMFSIIKTTKNHYKGEVLKSNEKNAVGEYWSITAHLYGNEVLHTIDDCKKYFDRAKKFFIDNLDNDFDKEVIEKIKNIVFDTYLKEDLTPEQKECQSNIAIELARSIKGEWQAVQDYKDSIARIKQACEYAKCPCGDKVVAILDDIVPEELTHVGELEKALELVKGLDSTSAIEDGKKEAEETLDSVLDKLDSGEIEEVDESLLEKKSKSKKKNQLKDMTNFNKKTDKKGAMGWYDGAKPHLTKVAGGTLNKNAGNVEHNVAFFNHAMGNGSASADGSIGAVAPASAGATVGAGGGMGESLVANEDIKKQADIVYKGFTIEHFPLTWTYNGKTEDVDGYVIKSPYYLQSNPEKEKYYLPLYCEDEKGNDINFKTLESAKDYIDKYMVTKKGKVVIKHGDEVHFELLDKVEDDDNESLKEELFDLYRCYDDIYNCNDYNDLQNVISEYGLNSFESEDGEEGTIIELYKVNDNTGDEHIIGKVLFDKDNKFKKFIKESLNETVEKHETLNPVLFDENNKLKPEVREKLLAIAKEFTDGLAEDEIKFDLKDIKIVGSNCSYNYNSDSDIDLHLVMDTKSLNCPDDLYPLLYSAYRSLFNGKLDPTIKGIPVELFVETDETEDLNKVEEARQKEYKIEIKHIDKVENISYNFGGEFDEKKFLQSVKDDYGWEPNEVEYVIKNKEELEEARQQTAVKSNGVYSVMKDEWIKEPVAEDIPEINHEELDKQVAEWKERCEQVKQSKSIEEIENFIEDIYDLRKTSIANDGEYGLGNLVFKELRSAKCLDELKELKNELKSKELSLESINF